jgi:hypothetical protein
MFELSFGPRRRMIPPFTLDLDLLSAASNARRYPDDPLSDPQQRHGFFDLLWHDARFAPFRRFALPE